ncbi:hypothetical protein C1H46_022914 [Malus baccata]|uniref:MSP domain-containing protein n=1 Tax=Malus baccata TaxID=106549 RepID=A0A540LYM6_MALBA|nr:hypothetical protein C1H46_022914 [Malus baccata]
MLLSHRTGVKYITLLQARQRVLGTTDLNSSNIGAHDRIGQKSRESHDVAFWLWDPQNHVISALVRASANANLLLLPPPTSSSSFIRIIPPSQSSPVQSSPVRIPMDKKLVQVSEQEICIDFALDSKCRANVRLTSLCATTAVAFKVQTSSPHKFLVKPPTGLIPPLSHVTFQVILKPQIQLPPAYPRSPSDKFLIRTAEFTTELTHSDSINHWFSSSSCPRGSTHDIKLKVAFVGPLLLRHAVTCGDYDGVRNIIKRQRTILAELPPAEAESILQIATELDNPENLINLLLEGGLRIDPISDQVHYGGDSKCPSNGRDELDVAEACDRLDDVLGLRESEPLDSKDRGNGRCAEVRKSRADPTTTIGHSRSRHDFVHDKDKLEMGELMLMAARRGDLKNVELLLQNGADINCCDQYGLTALHAAAIKGHKDVARVLIRFGSDLESQDGEGHAPLHMAVVGGSLETVKILVHGGANVNAKSNGGATPLYMATAMGYDDITEFLTSRKH